jgi:uncharacterized protein YuzE
VELTFDPEADALYVRLRDGAYARSVELDDRRRIDYDQDGEPIGVEMLGVSEGLSFQGLPDERRLEQFVGSRLLPRPYRVVSRGAVLNARYGTVGATIRVSEAPPDVSLSTWIEVGASVGT